MLHSSLAWTPSPDNSTRSTRLRIVSLRLSETRVQPQTSHLLEGDSSSKLEQAALLIIVANDTVALSATACFCFSRAQRVSLYSTGQGPQVERQVTDSWRVPMRRQYRNTSTRFCESRVFFLLPTGFVSETKTRCGEKGARVTPCSSHRRS